MAFFWHTRNGWSEIWVIFSLFRSSSSFFFFARGGMGGGGIGRKPVDTLLRVVLTNGDIQYEIICIGITRIH